MITIFAFAVGLFLAFSNGANDNFKGVATLLGSKTTTYKTALIWATLTTLAGSLTAFFLAQELMTNFSGKGLVPDEVLKLETFAASVALASGLTVFLATRLGFPISTTHGIVGALIGTGLLASPNGVHLEKLVTAFFVPLLVSPVLAIIGTTIFYPSLRFCMNGLGLKKESCVCVGPEAIQAAPAMLASSQFKVMTGTLETCEKATMGQFGGVSFKSVLDTSHFLTSGMVGFARGLNDTPKIAAILMVGHSMSPMTSTGLVALTMALGGVLFARKIAETMSYQITAMNEEQGFSANLITSLIVIGASKFGMPVSTTHVSCGSLFGIGIITKEAKWSSILKIVLSWVITLPVAGILGYLVFMVLKLLT